VPERSKLADRMQWRTLAQAAKDLALAFDNEFTEADVLQFALAGELRISARFTGPVTAMQLTPGDVFQRVDDNNDWELVGEEFPDEPFMALPNGLYDLPMTGVERLAVEHEFQQRTGGPKVKAPERIEGPFVMSWSTRAKFQLQEKPGRLNPCGQSARYLPAGTTFVVRRLALQDFIEETPPSQRLGWNAAYRTDYCRPPATESEPNTSESANTSRQASDSPAGTPRMVGGPNLAAWLRAEMTERNHLSMNRLHVDSKLANKTIKKILRGEPVMAVSRDKLAEGLSENGPRVLVDAIPID